MRIKNEYSFKDIKALLPYDYPFLFIDKAVSVTVDEKITCIKNITGNEYYFSGHFKDDPIVPGVILIEAMAQSTYLLGRLSALYCNKKVKVQVKRGRYYLARIQDLRFFKPVYPGDQIIIHVMIKKKVKNTELVEADVCVKSDLVCHGELIFATK
ncbi:beta-hydroxyacyl-ACP dehydratase [bacterium]|nr:MAG: beta-hydroxyacyl-ACP dehydratase [bacterium]